MNKNPNISNLDTDQMKRLAFDADNDAQRVIIVGQLGKYPTPETALVEPRIIYVDKPFVVKEIEIREVEKPVTVIQERVITVEKPIIVKEIEYVEKPIIVKEYVIEVREIEKPVVVENLKDLPSWVKLLLVVQVISVLVMVAHNLLR